MTAQMELSVEYRRDGDDRILLAMGSPAFPDIQIDYTGIPQDQRKGTATKLACAAALYCYASTLATALTARGATINSLTGRATVKRGPDARNRDKMNHISIEVQVDVPESDLPILEKCTQIMKNGCMVTYSFEQGIEVEYAIRRVGQNAHRYDP